MEIKYIQKHFSKFIIEYYKEINSTHNVAKEKANLEKKEEKILIAEKQTNGIGTKGRNWYTGENKNIAISILLFPQIKANKLEGLTVKIAEAMQETIYELYKIRLEIKFPNDLMLNNKKIGGILTEIHTLGENVNYLIISMGFNVNENSFNEETKQIATSLKNEYNKEFKREEIITRFLEKIMLIKNNLN